MAAALSCGARRSGVSALHKKRAPHPSHHEAASAVNQAEALTHHAGTLNTQVQSWGKGHPPPLIYGKLSSMKPVLGDGKVEDCCSKGIHTIPQDTHVCRAV